ncbi:MAG TPA: TonB family protein [Paucimonas sp.]|nr:TonB family protein [Paucimonas sp.]
MEFSGAERQPGRRLTGFGVVVLLHVLVVYALLTGLARKVVEVIKQPIETKIIEEVKPPPPPDLPPPPPPPKMVAPPPPFIPPPEVQVAAPPPQNTIAAVSNVKPDNPTFARPQPPVDAKPAAGPSRVAAVVDFSTCAKPEYPRNSQRNEEQGTVTLAFLIGVDGSVKEAKIEKSSGFRELDRAAQRGLSQCKFKPALVEGKPQEGWSSVQYVWRLE